MTDPGNLLQSTGDWFYQLCGGIALLLTALAAIRSSRPASKPPAERRVDPQARAAADRYTSLYQKWLEAERRHSDERVKAARAEEKCAMQEQQIAELRLRIQDLLREITRWQDRFSDARKNS